MSPSAPRTRDRPGFRPLQGTLAVLVLVTAVGILGMAALLRVVDGSSGAAGQAGWMRAVLDDGLGFWPVFFLLPALLGLSLTIWLRRSGWPVAVALAGGLVTITAYLWLLVALGTFAQRGVG